MKMFMRVKAILKVRNRGLKQNGVRDVKPSNGDDLTDSLVLCKFDLYVVYL